MDQLGNAGPERCADGVVVKVVTPSGLIEPVCCTAEWQLAKAQQHTH
jgi:hypothetical protein